MSSEPTIVAEGVSKCYFIYDRPQDRLWQMLWRGKRKFFREYWALHDIDLEVHKGETLGILGRNGAGKSTLLQILTGTLQATAGRVATTGRVAALLELGAGFNPEFTGRENVFMAASILGLTHAEIEARYDDIIGFAGIGDFVEQPVKTYSSGMYARLAFAVAAHVDADVLIVDEILSVGDAAFAQKCMRFINSFKEHGTILFVTHDIAAATKLCDRALWLDRGSVRELGPAKDVCDHYMAWVNGGDDSEGSFRIGRSRQRETQDGTTASVVIDPRHDLLKASDRANQIEVFEFNPDANWFGHGAGRIVDVALLDDDGTRLRTLNGGETVTLRIQAEAAQDIVNPILGFYIRDRLGQNLIGDNTFLSTLDRDLQVRAGERVEARFRFQMPYLQPGDFAITAALAEGTEAHHVHHHWIDDAVFFTVVRAHFIHSIIGVPMLGVEMTISSNY